MREVRPESWRWRKLAAEALDTSLEIGDGQPDLDGLLEANDRVRARNTGRTGRDRC
jgi:hypothetical protein